MENENQPPSPKEFVLRVSGLDYQNNKADRKLLIEIILDRADAELRYKHNIILWDQLEKKIVVRDLKLLILNMRPSMRAAAFLGGATVIVKDMAVRKAFGLPQFGKQEKGVSKEWR